MTGTRRGDSYVAPITTARRPRSGLPLLLLGAGAAVGAGLLLALGSGSSGPAASSAAPDSATPPAPAPVPESAPPLKLSWTRASVALGDAADPYNPDVEALTIALNQRRPLDPASTAGALYNGIRSIIGAVPIVGQIVNLGMTLFDFVGPLVVGPSSGGWRDLSILARQRAVLYQVVPAFYERRRPFRSQQIDPTAPIDKPIRYAGTGIAMPEEEYSRLYRAWLRRFLQTRRYEAEFFRIVHTLDEVCLPAVVMELLFRDDVWPPPLEPMPPRAAEFRARYANTQNPLASYNFDESAIDFDNPITREVFEQLAFEYRDDAERFANRIANVAIPAELLWLADNAGSVPRLGSRAAPKRSSAIGY